MPSMAGTSVTEHPACPTHPLASAHACRARAAHACRRRNERRVTTPRSDGTSQGSAHPHAGGACGNKGECNKGCQRKSSWAASQHPANLKNMCSFQSCQPPTHTRQPPELAARRRRSTTTTDSLMIAALMMPAPQGACSTGCCSRRGRYSLRSRCSKPPPCLPLIWPSSPPSPAPSHRRARPALRGTGHTAKRLPAGHCCAASAGRPPAGGALSHNQ